MNDRNNNKVRKILIVDDESDLRDIYTYRLEADGYRVVAVDGSRQAIRLARSSTGEFDLIVTDIMMSDGDGLELVAFAVGHNIPVIVATAYAAKVAHQIPEQVRILCKPFDLDELSQALQAEIQEMEKTTS